MSGGATAHDNAAKLWASSGDSGDRKRATHTSESWSNGAIVVHFNDNEIGLCLYKG